MKLDMSRFTASGCIVFACLLSFEGSSLKADDPKPEVPKVAVPAETKPEVKAEVKEEKPPAAEEKPTVAEAKPKPAKPNRKQKAAAEAKKAAELAAKEAEQKAAEVKTPPPQLLADKGLEAAVRAEIYEMLFNQ